MTIHGFIVLSKNNKKNIIYVNYPYICVLSVDGTWCMGFFVICTTLDQIKWSIVKMERNRRVNRPSCEGGESGDVSAPLAT